MKKIFNFVLFVSLFMISFPALEAQKSLEEGHIQYEVIDIESESPEAAMMKGTLIDIFFNQTNSKMNLQMMGGMISMDILTEIKSEKSTMFMNMMGRKVQVDQETKEEEKKEIPEFEITYDKSDKKTIAGEKCIKATLVKKDSNETITMYVANKIKPIVKMADEMFPGLEGLPMEIILNSEGMIVTISAILFEKTVNKTAFDAPEGYEKMTLEQFQKEMGGMGNLGF